MFAIFANSIVQVSPGPYFFLTILQLACLYVLLHLTCVACCLRFFPFFLYLLSVHSEKKGQFTFRAISFFFLSVFHCHFLFHSQCICISSVPDVTYTHIYIIYIYIYMHILTVLLLTVMESLLPCVLLPCGA